MAFESPIFHITGALASGDLSSYQFYCVKKNSTDKQYALCDTDGEVFDGILQNKPSAANTAAEIMALGISKLEAGETLTAGNLWGTDSSGKGKKIEGTNTGADVGDFVMGRVIVGAANGELATVTVGLLTFRVESV